MSVPSYDADINADSGHLSLREYQDDSASASPKLQTRVLDVGVGLICAVHKNTPSAWIADGLTNNGNISPYHLLLDDLCRPRNQVPPDPAPQFDGGQCDAVLYDISLRINRWIGANEQGVMQSRVDTYATSAYGAISGVTLALPGTFTSGSVTASGSQKVQATCRGLENLAPQPVGQFFILGDNSNPFISIESVSITRRDGQPDSCGSPSPTYPPALPSPGDLTTTKPVQITPTISVPVTVTIQPVVKFDPTVVAPVILFNAGGVNVKFDLGGFTFSPSFDFSTHTSNPTTNPLTVNIGQPAIKNPSKHCADDIDVLEIINRLDRIGRELEECCERDRPYPPPDANKVLTAVLGSGNSGLYDLPPDTFQIGLRISDQPLKVKQQDGYNAPGVLYAGWAWFGAANNMSERMPVDSEFKLFSPPRYISNTFGFTLYNGLTAIITAYSIKPKPPTP